MKNIHHLIPLIPFDVISENVASSNIFIDQFGCIFTAKKLKILPNEDAEYLRLNGELLKNTEICNGHSINVQTRMDDNGLGNIQQCAPEKC